MSRAAPDPDLARFRWFFGCRQKPSWFAASYTEGINIPGGWTLDQWRAVIDAAMACSPPPEPGQPDPGPPEGPR
jgi:hypothetical protein